ncbi:peptidoglycan-binding domain-containing protein [Ruegeria sp. 2205SS24-7]|uniref:peptidoglycan-binding domain-containing protein n=1 Tax=Ruegeria discodermiae TaxID=3064389 RepID=UPI0027409336|nr:peptidoglycan-binding domain-containing protein [Ruegeria sp. 2205SS24-7]MDP5217375.1 peptidoglycan-binding domain-containing protein [Ruegeria sp. 2205SS24-7]
MKKGAKGAPVKKVQEKLNKAGAKPKVTVSGVFDDAMMSAVKAFQKKHKLKIDGIVGDNTMAALDARGKAPKWGVKDISRGLKQLRMKKKDLTTSRIDIAVLAGEHHKNKEIKSAYRLFDISAETYSKYLLQFTRKMERIEELRVDFQRYLKGKPHEQKLAESEAQDLFKEMQKMNKIAAKLERIFERDHDMFLQKLDDTAVAA